MLLLENTEKAYNKKLIGTTWLAGNSSCTLVIPKTLAEEYGLDRPSNVVIQGRPEGILISKLTLGNNNCPNCREKVDTQRDRTQIIKTDQVGSPPSKSHAIQQVCLFTQDMRNVRVT
jgi:bifunctional DNA-binding transcriptional regulator/antitoxin component of YhaV-PrlF toxin-antitoxin module